ncbi:acyl-CoA dehydrogenase family protein [Antarcticimicrobium luteum]|uniref:Acyl-CoA dehydrogenase n=1 Tax=Antarcticimicrobium luteum TaxID=2547397 RepID=A0A4R5VE58_9RHOB|nr:acyl-CoA dehydrogenase family protein [Antarcticimicrobium luteum]TDK50684.1 hypothetical protein E1832_05665 [Antarcticimicrobium luteum]
MIHFDLPSDVALLLRDTAERFVAENYALPQRAEMLAAAPEEAPRLWSAMAELGWLAAPLQEAVGGLGLTPVHIVPLLEALGAGLVLEPVVPAMRCAATLARALPENEAATALEPVLSGERIEVLAEGAEGAPITATRDGDRVMLLGTAPLVPGGAAAAAFWAVAELGGAPILIRVAAEAASVAAFRLLDGQAAARVCFDGASCAVSEAVPDCAGAALDFGTDMGLVGALAECSGLIDALYRATLDYVKLREQFGRPIGRFQAVQHRMADMFIAREEARSMLHLAAEALESEDAGFRARLVSAARVKIADNARRALRDAVQLHGGMGVTDELAVGHMVKRLLVLTQLGGSRGAHLKRFRDTA